MLRRLALVVTVLLLAASCSSNESDDAVATTTSAEPSTTSTTAATTTTTLAKVVGDPTPIAELLGRGDSRYPDLGNRGYDVEHYTVDITFDPEPNTVNALVTIDAAATLPIELFSLDFIGFEVTGVRVDGEQAIYERQDGKLIIDAGTLIPAGESFSVAVTYSGQPEPLLSQALPFYIGWLTDSNGTAYVAAEPDGARSWLPVNDHPSDKATYTFMITVPDPLTAAANGVHTETITDLGWSTWVWEMDQPMASYLATVVIGDLDLISDRGSSAIAGVDVRNVVPDDLSPETLATLDLHGEMIDFLSQTYGPYPFAAYGIAVVDDFEAALENQTLSVFGRSMVDVPSFFETVMIHELAHQWFGDSISPGDWGDVWLNEGFATYAEWLWIEHTRGEAAMLATISGSRDQMAIAELAPPGNPPADDLFNASVYLRGGLVLHALRAEVGDDAFFEILRTYADTFRNGIATTGDFIAIARQVSGKDLTALFDDWLYDEQVPPLP
jgi:aminopeptidase N